MTVDIRNILAKSPETLRRVLTIPHAAAFGFLLLTLATAGRYGFYGDELYYFACSKHLDFGYVDHPPLVAVLTLVDTWIFGETKFGLRLMSGLAGAITVLFSAKIAEVLGGGKPAQSLAALSICFAAAFPAISSFFSMNPVDITLCTVLIYFLIKTVDSPFPQRWLALGILGGIGMLNKYTFLVLAFSFLISFVAARRWDVLKTKWLYLSGLMSLLIFSPHIIWQIEHGWPTLEFMRNATKYKNLSLTPFAFVGQLIIGLNPFTLPLWLSGLGYLFFGREMKKYRYLGWMAVVFLLVYMFQNSKFYYVLPVFPLLLASGAVAVEIFSIRHKISWPRRALISAVVISGSMLMPLAVPLLPIEQFVSYAKTLGLWNLVRMEKGEGDMPPLHFVYRFGWEGLVDSVGVAYNALPEDERNKCAVLASWYGVAGAIDHFGPGHGLPPSVCPRNSYWTWGPRTYSGELVLAVGYDAAYLEQFFGSVKRVGFFKKSYGYDAEICLCRKPRAPLWQMWPQFKKFI